MQIKDTSLSQQAMQEKMMENIDFTSDEPSGELFEDNIKKAADDNNGTVVDEVVIIGEKRNFDQVEPELEDKPDQGGQNGNQNGV